MIVTPGLVQRYDSKHVRSAPDFAVPIQVRDPLPCFCVSVHSRHKGCFRNLLIARNLLNYGCFRVSIRVLIMLKMLIMDGFAVQTQCNLFQ